MSIARKPRKRFVLALKTTEPKSFFFLTGGTQTNKTVISALLKSFEGVVAAESAHVSTHEAGAIESRAQGYNPSRKIRKIFCKVCRRQNHGHTVFPNGLSFPPHRVRNSLFGGPSLRKYTAYAKKFGLPFISTVPAFFAGLLRREPTLHLKTFRLFAMLFISEEPRRELFCGEAVVFPRGNAPARFFSPISSSRGSPAKGRLLGLQFNALLPTAFMKGLRKTL